MSSSQGALDPGAKAIHSAKEEDISGKEFRGAPMTTNTFTDTGVGGKVDIGLTRVEKPGVVAEGSLAAESLKSGGDFAGGEGVKVSDVDAAQEGGNKIHDSNA
ncbi:hypothetical protein YB2330_003004 [Saitoella coloradoensis]